MSHIWKAFKIAAVYTLCQQKLCISKLQFSFTDYLHHSAGLLACLRHVRSQWRPAGRWASCGGGQQEGKEEVPAALFLEPVQTRVQTICRKNFSAGIADALFLAGTDQCWGGSQKRAENRSGFQAGFTFDISGLVFKGDIFFWNPFRGSH